MAWDRTVTLPPVPRITVCAGCRKPGGTLQRLDKNVRGAPLVHAKKPSCVIALQQRVRDMEAAAVAAAEGDDAPT